MKKHSLFIRIPLIIVFTFIVENTFAQWQKIYPIDSFPEARPVTFVIGDTVYMGNGDTGFFNYSNAFRGYIQNSNTWVKEPAYPGVGGNRGFSFVIGDTAYVGDGGTYGFTNSFYAYSPSTGWISKDTVPGGGRALSVGFSIGKIGYFGTGDSYNADNDFYEFDPTIGTNGRWTKKANLPVSRIGCVGFVANGVGYIGLGGDQTGATYRDMYQYIPTLDKWDTMSSMPSDTGMEEAAYFAINGKLIVALGDTVMSGYSITKQTWMFDPSNGSKGTWTRLQDFPGPLPAYSPGGWAMGDTGFVYGGYDEPNNNYYREDMYRYLLTTTGINQLSANSNQISIYPNPSTGLVTITSAQTISNVTVTNLVGQVIYTAQPKQTTFNFELKDEGMYFITIKSGDNIMTRKLVVSR